MDYGEVTNKALDALTKREWNYYFCVTIDSWALPLAIYKDRNYFAIHLFCFQWRWSRNPYYADELSSIFKKPAVWIWRHLSGGEAPFYQGAGLKSYVAPIPPSEKDWRGWKLWLWNKAVNHLVYIRFLSHTPAMKGDF